MALPKTLISAFSDELSKIASDPAGQVNRAYGLPLKPQKNGNKRIDRGAETDAAYRSHAMLFGDQNPNYASSEVVTGAHNSPGGV